MPTKDQIIEDQKKEIESLKEQLKFCKMVAEKGEKTEIHEMPTEGVNAAPHEHEETTATSEHT